MTDPDPTGPAATGPDPADDDRGCLRLVLAVPSALLTLVAGFLCRTALVTRPSGPWDDAAHAGIDLSCLLTLLAAAAVLGGRLLGRRVLGWAWAAPALARATVAAARRATPG
ncbi:hypothetical protein ACFV2N_26210 [Streptomyces sp. NPDC059680]|uniref:hypothetical protein n=1 Tax=Streptomyces sp. NPDC059680 TaxID=3346904 RepID=UPI00368036B5